MLMPDPVVQELQSRGEVGGAMHAPAVVERPDGVEASAMAAPLVLDRAPCTRSCLWLLKKLSVGALSQSLPSRLIEQTMSSFFNRA
jgi:hypothetical protein